jgi:hypothetical protein
MVAFSGHIQAFWSVSNDVDARNHIVFHQICVLFQYANQTAIKMLLGVTGLDRAICGAVIPHLVASNVVITLVHF